MNTTIFLFNGPPGSGKDTAATLIHQELEALQDKGDPSFIWTTDLKFAQPIDDAIEAFLGAPDLVERYQSLKNDPVAKNSTPIIEGSVAVRPAKIAFSEEWAKKVFGETVFAEIAAQKAIAFAKNARSEELPSVITISDCGFQYEFDAFCRAVAEGLGAPDPEKNWAGFHLDGPVKFVLCQMHRDGCDFSNDSREYVEGNLYTDCDWYEVDNNGSLSDLKGLLWEIFQVEMI